MCAREDGTSTKQNDEVGYCPLKFQNDGQIVNWRENAICQETFGNLSVKHLCEKTCL